MAPAKSDQLGPDTFKQVQESYARVADQGLGLDRDLRAEALIMGYSEEDLRDAPLMGLGCGNPVGFADLKPSEAVLDLGCGGGFDCFLAGNKVGATGRVVGIDMTAEMIRTAREAVKHRPQSGHVSFRLGEIEHLPVADKEVDVIISNGVVCLSLNLAQVFREAFRALKPGGRMAICDMVQMQALPDELKTARAFSSWVAGAPPVPDLIAQLVAAGFTDVSVRPRESSREFVKTWMDGAGAENFVLAADVTARKPASKL